jgi:hypothetical protein
MMEVVREVLMKNSQIVEEPCEVKISSTVLKTSREGDFFTEFNKTGFLGCAIA